MESVLDWYENQERFCNAFLWVNKETPKTKNWGSHFSHVTIYVFVDKYVTYEDFIFVNVFLKSVPIKRQSIQ